MKRLISIVAGLALVIGVGACGSTQTAEQKHSGFYNMATLASNLEHGTEQNPGAGHVTGSKCVPTVKATATCEVILESSADKKTESATIAIDPKGTGFVISHRESSHEAKPESSERSSSSSTGGTWDEEEKKEFTRALGAIKSEATVACMLSKLESKYSTEAAWERAPATGDASAECER